jgi:hypothetical protein
MDYGLRYPFQNYIAELSAIGSNFGKNIGEGWKKHKIQSALSNFEGDYEAAAQELMRMGYVDDATRLYTAGQLAKYRDIQGQVALDKPLSLDQQIYQDYKSGNLPGVGAGPSYVAPPDTESAADAAEEAEASGVAGTSYVKPSGFQTAQNMPNMIAEKVLPPEELARRRAAGGLAADREDYDAKRGIFGKRADAVMEDLYNKVSGFDDATVENALGPLQGAEQEGWRATLQNIPQMYGEARNKYWDGGDNSTYELRGVIRGSVNALTNAIKPFVRVKGDVWSDRDQALLTSIMGDLQESQDRGELNRRFNNAVDRINKAWDFDIKFRAPESNPDARVNIDAPNVGVAKNTDRMTPEAPAARSVPTYNVDPTTGSMSPNENTMVGGENIGRTTRQPPTPPTRALNALKAYRNNPQARAAFDEIYGPGAAEFYLQKYR